MSFPPVTALLPHRPPFLFVDRVVSRDGGVLVSVGAITREHAGPVLPGWAIVEGLAQSLVCLAALERLDRGGPEERGFLTGVVAARFASVALPAVVEFRVEVFERRFGVTRAHGIARVGGEVVGEAELHAAIVPVEVSP